MFSPSFKSDTLVFYYLTPLVLNCWNLTPPLVVIFLAVWYSSLVLPFSAYFSASFSICSSQTLLSSLALCLTSLSFILYFSRSLPFFSFLILCCVFCHGSSAAGLLLSRFSPSTIICFSSSLDLELFLQFLCKLFPFVCIPRCYFLRPLVLQIYCAVRR